MSLHALPPPVMEPGGKYLMLSSDIEAQVMDGAYGECVACHRTCWSWWSPAPPSGFVALHRDRCPLRLRQMWAETLADGITEEAPAAVAPSGRGAYGRRRAVAPARTEKTRLTLAVRRGIEIPQEFTPGPFWKPGYSHLEPWVVLFASGAGGGHVPFGRHEDSARVCLRGLSFARAVDNGVPVVGAVLLAPDGARVQEWGEAPVAGEVRWEGIARIPEWRRCAGCSQPRWPGSWQTVKTGRCRVCQQLVETADPRPWPKDPPDPGLGWAPEWLGGPKKSKRAADKKGVAVS